MDKSQLNIRSRFLSQSELLWLPCAIHQFRKGQQRIPYLPMVNQLMQQCQTYVIHIQGEGFLFLSDCILTLFILNPHVESSPLQTTPASSSLSLSRTITPCSSVTSSKTTMSSSPASASAGSLSMAGTATVTPLVTASKDTSDKSQKIPRTEDLVRNDSSSAWEIPAQLWTFWLFFKLPHSSILSFQ